MLLKNGKCVRDVLLLNKLISSQIKIQYIRNTSPPSQPHPLTSLSGPSPRAPPTPMKQG